jgi:hypothetical protein
LINITIGFIDLKFIINLPSDAKNLGPLIKRNKGKIGFRFIVESDPAISRIIDNRGQIILTPIISRKKRVLNIPFSVRSINVVAGTLPGKCLLQVEDMVINLFKGFKKMNIAQAKQTRENTTEDRKVKLLERFFFKDHDGNYFRV